MIYTVMKNHWTHACGSTLKLIPLEQCCDHCGTSREIEAVRFEGFSPYWPFTDEVAKARGVKVKRKGSLFAMMMFKRKNKAK